MYANNKIKFRDKYLECMLAKTNFFFWDKINQHEINVISLISRFSTFIFKICALNSLQSDITKTRVISAMPRNKKPNKEEMGGSTEDQKQSVEEGVPETDQDDGMDPYESIYASQDVLQSLDLDVDPAIKRAYREYCDSLKKEDMLIRMARGLWVDSGMPDDVHWKTIQDQFTPLQEILPIYVEAIVRLSLERCDEDTPLAWWRRYRMGIDTSWFDKIYHRIPKDNMNKRMHNDVDGFYRMDDQETLRGGACHSFYLSFDIEELISLFGRTEEEIKLMRTDIDIDKKEYSRRLTVWQRNVTQRLTYNPEGYRNSLEAMRETHPKGLSTFQWMRSTGMNRRMARRENTLAQLEGKDAEKDGIDDTRRLCVDTARVLRTVISVVEHLSCAHKELVDELRNNKLNMGDGRGRGRRSGVNEKPKWMQECDPEVQALTEDDALRFETHGREENDMQTKGRKMRDDIMADYDSLWDDKKLSWTKLSKQMKIEMCNRLGKPPLNWAPHITAKRVTNYIAKKRFKDAKAGKETKKTPEKKTPDVKKKKALPSTNVYPYSRRHFQMSNACILLSLC